MKPNPVYHIRTQRILPPVGRYNYKAWVAYIIENPGPNFKRIYPTDKDEWSKIERGETEAEAYSKVEVRIRAWIEKQKQED